MAVLDVTLGAIAHSLTLLKYLIGLPLALLFIYLIQNEIVRYRSQIKNLPGPRGLPVVGNLFQVIQFAYRSCKPGLQTDDNLDW